MTVGSSNEESTDVRLREILEGDILVFFDQQRDPVANQMAAFVAEDPDDRDAFAAKWARILADDTITRRTIVVNGKVAGHVVSFVAPWSGKLEVSYWIGREFWGRGVATKALTAFLRQVRTRPIHARVAKDNLASFRVLTKCGFTVCDHARAFANARGTEIDELILVLGLETNDE